MIQKLTWLGIALLFIACGDSPKKVQNQIQTPRVYGTSLQKPIQINNYHDNTTLYMPKSLKKETKLPLILLVPGWGSQNASDYESLLRFIASQGYIVAYAKDAWKYSAKNFIDRFSNLLAEETVARHIDKSKLGVVGHSAGGGLAVPVLEYFSSHGYGDSGRFIFIMDPWFPFEMTQKRFQNIPKNTHLLIQLYLKGTQTDPRIPLTIHDKLSFLGDSHRDYQLYHDITHGYPQGARPFSDMQIILKPLDALIEYTFHNNQEAYPIAMELGSDVPLQKHQETESLSPSEHYAYPCYGQLEPLKKVILEYGVDYCSILR
jgi:hypothetical protein